MNKELIFNGMIENILSSVTLGRFETGALIADSDSIIIQNETQKSYLTQVPETIENEKTHGNARNKLAKEFIKQYSFNSLKELYNKKIEEHNAHIQLQEDNKYKLENLYNKITFMEQYNSYRRGVNFFHGFNKYCIEFSCSKDKYHCDNIQIYLSSDYNNFDFKYNYKTTTLTEEEIISELKKLELIYKQELKSKKAIEEAKRLEEERKYKIQNKLIELFNSNKEIIFKNKKSFIGFRKGLRFAVGEGKRGKYYNCSFSQLYDLIINKNINEYSIINDEVNTYKLTNNELMNLSYSNIV